MTPPHPFAQYTTEVLRFDFAQSPPGPAPAPAEQPGGTVATALAGCLRAVEREPKPFVLLLGLGTGLLARELDAALPPGVRLIVSELDMRTARSALAEADAPWSRPGARTVLLADASPWAHFLLWTLHGLTPETAHLRLTPHCTGPEHSELRRLFAQAAPLRPSPALAAPPLAVAAILAPSDPGLDEFFAQIPPWASEVVAVWDADQPPANPPGCAAPVRHLARRLDGDFAAQRNAMLQACSADWVFSLDADERLTPGGWEAVRALAASAGENGAGAFLLPRRTLYPDAGHCLAGFGLWPDLQLRLYRRTPELRYERPVHEKLCGVRGPFGVACNLSITHLNRLLRDPASVRRKLAGFDSAGGGAIRHVLSADYPVLPSSFFPETDGPGDLRAVILPFDPA